MALHVDADDSYDTSMPPMDLADMEDDTERSVIPYVPPTVALKVDYPKRIHELECIIREKEEENQTIPQDLLRVSCNETMERDRQDLKEKSIQMKTQQNVIEIQTTQVELLEQQLQNLRTQLEEVERARQQAVFKISEMATSSPSDVSPDTQVEWIQKYKHDFELLNQRMRLNLAQQEERHNAALQVALGKQSLEHDIKIEKLKVEYEVSITEWKREEARRAKEIEVAMEADKNSVRLEMKHCIEKARIHQNVSIQPVRHNSVTSDGDAIVRLQLDALRTRRLDALKKISLIRISCGRMQLLSAWTHWKLHGSVDELRKFRRAREFVQTISKCLYRHIRRRFYTWYVNAKLHAWQYIHTSVLNRILAVERFHRLIQIRKTVSVLRAFTRWKCGAQGSDREAAHLRIEITKLHDELAKTKAETWRCKRQMLQQFKQSAM